MGLNDMYIILQHATQREYALLQRLAKSDQPELFGEAVDIVLRRIRRRQEVKHAE